MSGLKSGDKFPQGVKFKYIPWTKEIAEAKVCGLPVTYDADERFADKKVVIVSLPGAFTPTCSGRHVPAYIEKLSQLKAAGVDQVLVIAPNDAFVMSGWQKAPANHVKDSEVDNKYVVFASDLETKLAKTIGWTAQGDPERNGRFALVVDKGIVTYAGFESEDLQNVGVSGVNSVLDFLQKE